MSVREPLPQDAVDMVVASLLHLILPVLESEAAARALALRMLTEYQPESVRELHLAGEIIGFSLNGLKALGDCGAADSTPQKLVASRRWACSLSRSGHLAERRLEEMQRRRRAGLPEEAGEAAAEAAPEPAEAAAPIVREAAPLEPVDHPAPQPAPSGPDAELADAEAAFAAATAKLMQARWEGRARAAYAGWPANPGAAAYRRRYAPEAESGSPPARAGACPRCRVTAARGQSVAR